MTKAIYDDFIGWVSPDKTLEVIGVHSVGGGNTKFRVICHVCILDKELYPLGYFVSRKSSLLDGQKPCGCGSNPRWDESQYLIRSRRAAGDKFIVHSCIEKFHGGTTRVNCECVKHNYLWTPTFATLVAQKGCPKCAGNFKPTQHEAFLICTDICIKYGYSPVGFPDGYSGIRSSRFSYECPNHGLQTCDSANFVAGLSHCPDCKKESISFFGFYQDKVDLLDYLYVIDFDGQYIKVGRTFDIKKRLNGLSSRSRISNLHVLSIYSGSHRDVWYTEQFIHEELRRRGFDHCESYWTNETFTNDSLYVINNLLSKSGLTPTSI